MGSCPACGHRPVGDERLVSWLLSSQHLPQAELVEASERISNGTFPKPGPELLALARDALNPVPDARVEQPADPDAPLSTRERLQLLAFNLLFTPLVGLVLYFFWRRRRPVAARDALHLSWPVMLLAVVGWTLMLLR